MAEFGITSTQLQDAKGEGANVVSPVNTPATDSNWFLPFVEKGVDIFMKGLDKNDKLVQAQQEQEVIGRYVREQNKYSSALETGDMSVREHGVRSRDLFATYMSNFPGLESKLSSAHKTLGQGTALGIAEEEEKAQRDQRRADIASASKNGAIFYPGMSKVAEDSAIHADKQATIEQQRLNSFYRAKEFERQNTGFNNTQADREAKDLAQDSLRKIASVHITDFSVFGKDLGDQVRGGKMKPEMAAALLGERMGRITGTLSASSVHAPELSNAFKDVFVRLNEVNKQLISPGANAESAKAQVDLLLNHAQLLALQTSPKLLNTAAVNGLLPTMAPDLLMSTKEASDVIVKLTGASVDGRAPPLIGTDDPVQEKQVMDLLRKSLKPIASNNPQINKALAESQQTGMVNHLMKQLGDTLNRGDITASDLEPAAKVIASSDFGALASKKQFDPQLATVATRALQIYQNAVIGSVNDVLGKKLYLNKSPVKAGDNMPIGKGVKIGEYSDESRKEFKLSSSVDISFSPGGVSIIPKKTPEGMSVGEQDAIRDLKKAADGLNFLVRLEAHGQGSLDYVSVWEKNKHLYLPDIFPAPKEQAPVRPQTEKAMAEAVKLTPQEQANSGGTKEENIRDIKTELSRTKNPAIRAILEAELKKLGG